MTKKTIRGILIAVIVCAVIIGGFAVFMNKESHAAEMSREEAETFVNNTLRQMADTKTLSLISDKSRVTVKNVSYGDEKDIILDCTFDTVDVYGAVSPEYDAFMQADERKKNGTMFKSALDFKMEFEPHLAELVEAAQPVSSDGTIRIYDTQKGRVLYAEDDVINRAFGGIVNIEKDITEKKTVSVADAAGNVKEKELTSSNIKKGFIQCIGVKRSTEKPDTSTPVIAAWNGFKADFNRNFIEADRWKTIFKGLWVTLKLTFFALLIGIVLGFLVAFVRCTYIKNEKHGIILRILNKISEIYLTVIRGTPVVVQIMIIYFVIFMPLGVDKFLSAVVCFGLNSGAYVAEIVRGGIMSIDNGQTEAGRSLGFGYMATMLYIVFPQAFKAVLPALANEFVVLLKETSIAFYIGLGDMMYAVNAIRAATYTPFLPLIAAAILYLIMVLILSHLVTLLERRMRNNER